MSEEVLNIIGSFTKPGKAKPKDSIPEIAIGKANTKKVEDKDRFSLCEDKSNKEVGLGFYQGVAKNASGLGGKGIKYSLTEIDTSEGITVVTRYDEEFGSPGRETKVTGFRDRRILKLCYEDDYIDGKKKRIIASAELYIPRIREDGKVEGFNKIIQYFDNKGNITYTSPLLIDFNPPKLHAFN